MIFALITLSVYLWAVGVFMSVGLIPDRPDRSPKDWKIELFIVTTWPISLPTLVILGMMTGHWKKNG